MELLIAWLARSCCCRLRCVAFGLLRMFPLFDQFLSNAFLKASPKDSFYGEVLAWSSEVDKEVMDFWRAECLSKIRGVHTQAGLMLRFPRLVSTGRSSPSLVCTFSDVPGSLGLERAKVSQDWVDSSCQLQQPLTTGLPPADPAANHVSPQPCLTVATVLALFPLEKLGMIRAPSHPHAVGV